jgi:hypothetical protein
MIADLIAAGLQSGWALLRRPTMPEICGHDMDVPDIMLNFRGLSLASMGCTPSLKAARMLSPGAVTSGFKSNHMTKSSWLV